MRQRAPHRGQSAVFPMLQRAAQRVGFDAEMLANVFEGTWPVVVPLQDPLFGSDKQLYACAAASIKMMLKAVDRVAQRAQAGVFLPVRHGTCGG